MVTRHSGTLYLFRFRCRSSNSLESNGFHLPFLGPFHLDSGWIFCVSVSCLRKWEEEFFSAHLNIIGFYISRRDLLIQHAIAKILTLPYIVLFSGVCVVLFIHRLIAESFGIFPIEKSRQWTVFQAVFVVDFIARVVDSRDQSQRYQACLSPGHPKQKTKSRLVKAHCCRMNELHRPRSTFPVSTASLAIIQSKIQRTIPEIDGKRFPRKLAKHQYHESPSKQSRGERMKLSEILAMRMESKHKNMRGSCSVQSSRSFLLHPFP